MILGPLRVKKTFLSVRLVCNLNNIQTSGQRIMSRCSHTINDLILRICSDNDSLDGRLLFAIPKKGTDILHESISVVINGTER